MKNMIFFIALILCFQAMGQRKPKIKGNRNVVEVSESLPAFNAIELKDDLDITLQKASSEGYAISADDNLIDVLKFEVQDSTLIITSYYKITGKKKLDITIDYNYLESVTMFDGRIEMKDIISSEQLYINTFGSSKLQLNTNSTFVQVHMEGSSSGDLNINSDSLNIVLKDRIDVGIYAVSDSNILKMTESAGAKLEGTTNTFLVNISGNSSLKAEKLEANTVSADLEGSPSARINAYADFELSSRGDSKTYFYGPAKIKLIDFLDTSQLHREK
ncbi:GIN domain-containing protein [Maribacter algicola]|uniref:GIN domain-containing protein n=1 Tax=Meishania litoralis TaxID=3434685 RepID=A0ACC7LG34_9FLAO